MEWYIPTGIMGIGILIAYVIKYIVNKHYEKKINNIDVVKTAIGYYDHGWSFRPQDEQEVLLFDAREWARAFDKAIEDTRS